MFCLIKGGFHPPGLINWLIDYLLNSSDSSIAHATPLNNKVKNKNAPRPASSQSAILISKRINETTAKIDRELIANTFKNFFMLFYARCLADIQ